MPEFVREHLRPLLGSAGLHLLLLVVLAGAALHWTTEQPPVQLAIEGVIVDAKDLPKSVHAGRPLPEPPSPKQEPAPAPAPEPPAPDLKAAEEARQAERAAAEARAAREKAAAEERAVAEAEHRRAAEEAARKQAAEAADRKRAADAEAKAKAEAEARAKADAERKKVEQERAAREARLQSEREAELQRQLAAEEEAAAVARSGVMDEYRAVLIQAIERNWIRPPSARAGLECTLFVNQAAGGTVIDVKLGACNGDQAVRESITNAVYRASPLPAPRDPRAFERRLQIVFKPTE